MNQFFRRQRQEDDVKKEEQIVYFKEAMLKLLQWQVDNEIEVLPIMKFHPIHGLQPDLSFRRMIPEVKEMLQKELAERSGIVISKDDGLDLKKK